MSFSSLVCLFFRKQKYWIFLRSSKVQFVNVVVFFNQSLIYFFHRWFFTFVPYLGIVHICIFSLKIARFSDFAIFKKIDHSIKKIDLFFSANYCRITKIAKSQNRKIKKSRWNINRCGWCLSTYLIKFCQLFKVVQ